eukprot:14483434-Ditylum_brightwellii.AAC.2
MQFKTFSKVSNDPNYIEFSKLRREVYCNGAAMYSSLNKNYGHLGLVMAVTEYTVRNGDNPYISSLIHSRVYDTTIGINTSRVHQNRREAQHTQRVDVHLME